MATATAEVAKRRNVPARAKAKCHLERMDGTDNKWRPVADESPDNGPVKVVHFAGETDAKKYVIDNGLTGTFRCVWVGSEFVAEERKTVKIK